MPVDVSVETLFSMFNEEKKTGELLKVDRNFYAIAEQYVKAEEGATDENKKQKIANFKKLLASLRSLRERKILIYLAYNKQITNQMPNEEQELYIQVKKILESENPESGSVARIKVSADIPEIVMPNGNKLGPLKQNQIIEVESGKDLDFIIQNRIGEVI